MTDKPIDVATLSAALQKNSSGAALFFEGRVRNQNDGKEVIGLEYEAYCEMAEKIFSKIREESLLRFDIENLQIVHRYGQLDIGDVAVWIGTISTHRKASFEASAYAIDELKMRAPIWKKENYAHEESQWVLCQHSEAQTCPSLVKIA